MPHTYIECVPLPRVKVIDHFFSSFFFCPLLSVHAAHLQRVYCLTRVDVIFFFRGGGGEEREFIVHDMGGGGDLSLIEGDQSLIELFN
jgi:hypothetical protein